MASGLSKNDPNNAVVNSEKSGIRPGFLGGSGGGDKPSGLTGKSSDSEKTEKANQAKAEFGNAEDAAAEQEGGFYHGGDDVKSTRENEEEAGGYYSGSGRLNASEKKKLGFKGFLKKKGGPLGITAFILLFFGVGATSFTTGSFQINAWKENLDGTFGMNSAVIARRSNNVVMRLLGHTRKKGTNSVFDLDKTPKSKIVNKLKEKNIYVTEFSDADGGTESQFRVLLFEDANGKVVPIVSSDDDVSFANRFVGQTVDVSGDGQKMLTITEPSMTMNKAMSSNDSFRKSYDTATLTFTGKVAGWFDNVTESLLTRIIGPNARNQTKMDDPDQEKVEEMLLGNKSKGADDSDMEASNKEDTDENGKKMSEMEYDDGTGKTVTYDSVDAESDRIKTDSPSSDSVGKGLSARAQKVAMLSANAGCAFLKGIGAISTAVGAVVTTNVISYASKILETADAIKAGSGSEVTHLVLNSLNTPVKSENMYDTNGNPVDDIYGATTASPGFNAPFSSKNTVNENDPSAILVNKEYATKNALIQLNAGSVGNIAAEVAAIGSGMQAFRACNAAQGIAGAVDFAGDISSVFTFGIAGAVKEIIKGAIQGAALALVMVGITSVITAITPTVAQWFAGKLTHAFLGIPGGYSLLSGTHNIYDSNLQMSTGRYASKDNAIEVFGLTKDVEKEWAYYERATRSPFDITSQYTFLGSIYNSVLPIVHKPTAGTAFTTASLLADLTGTSALALMSPSVSATNEVGAFAFTLASEDNCSSLKSVDVAGDFACNKYSGAYVNELTTMDLEDNYQNMASYGSFDGEDSHGNPKVNVDSEYAKWIIACMTNDVQPGNMSGAVASFVSKATNGITNGSIVGNGIVNFGSNLIPFEGIIDVAEAVQEETNIPWNSGYACTGNTNDPSLNERVKNYSMYNLDQRVLYDMGLIESNSTMAFLEDYYKENPIDNSFEGQIARISGMDKEEVLDTLALIEYYTFVANYNPTERFTFGAPAVEMQDELKFDNENTLAGDATLLNAISFADIRNRTFAV